MQVEPRWRPLCPDASHLNTLMQCVVLSGLIKDASHTKEAIELSLAASLPKSLANHYINMLHGTSNTMPSRSTVYRHRSTLVLAHTLLAKAWNQQCLQNGGQARWSMVDSSPQGHVDYLLSTHSAVACADLLQLLSDSMLIEQDALGLLPDAEEAKVQLAWTGQVARILTCIASGEQLLGPDSAAGQLACFLDH